jgi:S1-C subfamily serine protease
MMHIRTWTGIGLVVVLLAAVGVAQDTKRPAKKQRGDTAKKAAPKTPRDTKKKADEEDDRSLEKLIEAASESIVIVRTWYQKDLSDPVTGQNGNWAAAQLYQEYVDKKRPAESAGVVLDAAGRVLIADSGIEDRFIQKIEIETHDGKRFPATRHQLLTDAPGIVLKVSAKAKGKLTPLTFAPLKNEGIRTKLGQIRLSKMDDKWNLQTGPMRPSVRYGKDRDGNAYYGYRSSGRYSGRYSSTLPAVLGDEEGRPVGCALSELLDLAQTECIWKGADLLKADGYAWGEFTKALEACRKNMTAATQEVVLTFHQGSDSGDEYRYSSRGPSATAGREISAYGMAISDTKIIVPMPLDRKTAAKIDKIYVKYSPTDRAPASFVGAYKDFAAFMVKLDKGKLPACLKLAAADPDRMKPFLVARARKRQGKKYVDLTTNRLAGKTRGHAGKYHWEAASSMQGGSLLVDFEGNVLGANLVQRLEHEEERQFQQAGRYYGSRSEERVFTVGELRDDITQPLAHMDPKILVKTRTQSKRRAWLGVEYVAMSPGLAEMLKVEAPTKDGQLGFIVNAVYAGSPAAKLGFKTGDILLRLKAPGMPYPIELNATLAGRGSFGSYRRYYGGGRGGGESMGPAPQTWKNRENILTRALDAIGVDKTISLTYYRPGEDGKGKAVTLEYKIQQAPPDSQSAKRWQNRKLGLTVKDVSYEIAHALNLPADAPGVIVAKVESGSPMLIARVFPNEIVTRLDDKPLTSAKQMRDRIAAAKKAGRDKVRLTVLRLGKTRFADLTVSDYDPTDDEGLDDK